MRPLPGIVDRKLVQLNTLFGPEERTRAIAESAKPHATVLDFVGNNDRHKLIPTAGILGGGDQ
jgi:hypothetical protein